MKSQEEKDSRDAALPAARRLPVKWIGIGLAVIALFMAGRLLPVDTWFQQFKAWVEGLGPTGVAIFGVVYVVAAIVLVPASVLTLGAGAIWGLAKGSVIVSVSSTLGAGAPFLIARYFARSKVEAYARRNPKFRAIDQAIGAKGGKILGLLRLSPVVPYNLSNYFFGLTALRFWPYLAISWITMLPATVLYVYIGVLVDTAAGGASEGDLLENVVLGIGFALTLVVTVYVTRVARAALAAAGGLAETTDADATAAPAPVAARGPRRRGMIVLMLGLLFLGAGAAVWQQGAIHSLFKPRAVMLAEAYAPRPDGPTFDHTAFDALLKTHVKAKGLMDYAGLKKDAADLDAYIAALGDAPFDALGRDEKLALLINAYNAFTLRLILDYWPVSSIKKIPASKRWDHTRWKIGKRTLSLAAIENDYLRAKFEEPRIHFAVNCASIGCPPLRAEAYVGERIGAQLEDQATRMHADARWCRFDARRKTVHLSPIYDWFSGDFEQVAGSALRYAARYEKALAAALRAQPRVRVRWSDYDWSINAAR